MRAYILAHEDAVMRWRYLMGPTKVYQARNTSPDSIRGAYGLTDTRNTTHGSGKNTWAGRVEEGPEAGIVSVHLLPLLVPKPHVPPSLQVPLIQADALHSPQSCDSWMHR